MLSHGDGAATRSSSAGGEAGSHTVLSGHVGSWKGVGKWWGTALELRRPWCHGSAGGCCDEWRRGGWGLGFHGLSFILSNLLKKESVL